MKKIAIFASGGGSNAAKIMEYFQHHGSIEVAVVASNNPRAPVLEKAAQFNVPTITFDRNTFYNSTEVLSHLQTLQIDLVVLAGFLWLVPPYLVAAFPNKMVNIHPALLPKYGGKGMHGRHVHEAVHAAQEPESGITIHFVNEHYDEGSIVFQTTCRITPEDTPEDIAAKVLALEHQFFAPVLEQLLQQ